MEGAQQVPLRHEKIKRGTMSEEAAGPHLPNAATILPFPRVEQRRFVAMAPTLELYSGTFQTQERMLMWLRTWLFSAERDGVNVRHPGYEEALRRAIRALEVAQSVPNAIALLRSQEAGLEARRPSKPSKSLVLHFRPHVQPQ